MWHVIGTEWKSSQYWISREQNVCDLRGSGELRGKERPAPSVSRGLIRTQYDTRPDQLSRVVQSEFRNDSMGNQDGENDAMLTTF